jgi:hypothetical protein
MSPPYYGHTPSDGLHVLKDKWKQKSYLGQQSRSLSNELVVAIDATFDAAPLRTQGFHLHRPANAAMHRTQRERKLEAAMLQRWNKEGSPISKRWERLVAAQIPLFDARQKRYWGYIDLLGTSLQGVPIVIELKKSPSSRSGRGTDSSETPLRMVMEAAAYAIALRKNWPAFRSEWIYHLKILRIPDKVIAKVPTDLHLVPLVVAAPASFWLDWLPVTEKGRSIPPDAWQSFAALLVELQNADLPVSFVSVSGHDVEIEGLGVQAIDIFPFVLAPRNS